MLPRRFFCLLGSAVIAASHEQHVLNFAHPTPTAPGVLRRFTPQTSENLVAVLRIAQAHNLDIWNINANSAPHVDIYSPPSSPPLPTELLSIAHSVNNINIPESFEPRLGAENWDLSSLTNSTFHAEYHTQAEIDSFIHDMAQLHPTSATVFKLGYSAEGREMLGIKISAPSNGTVRSPKLNFVIFGAQHAREWIATSTALYLAHALLANKSESNSLASLLEIYDFHIAPSPNPDGYAYTWESDRFWYKNRNIVDPIANCTGTDMTRNWGAHWEPTADPPTPWLKKNETVDPCSPWYPGHRAFDAPEVNNLANYIAAINDANKNQTGIAAFLDLRSYGQMLVRPYSYTCDRLPQDADLIEAMLGTAYAGKSPYGTPFLTGTPCEVLYYASAGNVLDYMYETERIQYAYTVYLRDTGTHGFALPPAWIRPVGEETAVMVKYLSQFVARKRSVGL
ncbi:peptidase M14 [Mycena olivaceomarginata]|nr:peptidase M14 [Mycena olivaceomarginata]